MSYSGGIAEWSAGTVLATEQRGWKTSLWTALVDTTEEPSVSSADWQLDSKVASGMISFECELCYKENSVNFVTLDFINFTEQHENRGSSTELSAISFQRYRSEPYLKTFISE